MRYFPAIAAAVASNTRVGFANPRGNALALETPTVMLGSIFQLYATPLRFDGAGSFRISSGLGGGVQLPCSCSIFPEI